MKGLETGKDKVKKICELLRKETLEPAEQEAQQIIADAQMRAETIVREGREAMEKMMEAAHLEIERQKNVFHSSLNQACKQALERLREQIEEKLFNRELGRLVVQETQNPQVLAEMVQAVVGALEKEGIDVDLSIYIPAAIPARSVNLLLAKEIIDRLKEKSVLLGDFEGGIAVKIHKDNITIDITDKALKELVANYIRKDFRELIFQASL
jgi:V/A-type H+/Na+-transporting ATPase subunit E